MISISTVFDRTTAFIADNKGALLPFALLLTAITAVQQIAAPLGCGLGGPAQAGLSLGKLVLSLASLWPQLAVAALVLGASGARGAAATASRRFTPAVAVLLFVFAAAAIAAAPAIVLWVKAGVSFDQCTAAASPPGDAATRVALGSLWFFGVVVVGLGVLARLLPLTGVLVAERGGVSAVIRTLRLTRGLTWRLIGTLLLFSVVLMVATLATKGVVGSVLALLLGDDGAVTTASVLTGIATAAVSTGFSVLAAVFVAMLYRALAGEGAPRTAP